MAFTVVALAALLAVASAGLPAARYPAGVNPAECPNFPYCHDGLNGNHAVGTYKSGYSGVVAAAPYAYGAVSPYAYSAVSPYAYSAASPYAYSAAPALVVAAAGGAKYPAGVNPAECPNFPYCHDGYNGNHAVGTYKSAYTGVVPVAAAVAHGYGYARQYPAGVNPAACPNYPFCH